MPPASPLQPVALFHRDFGGAGDPPFVILHGMLGSSRNWQTVGRDLARGRRVFALDLRNHGMSPHAESMSYEAMAADVVAWLDARGVDGAELIGHSMGGKVAMLLACRHAARVRRLVAVDIAPRDYHWPARWTEFAAMNGLDLASLRSRAEAEVRLEALVPSWAMRKFIATNIERLPGGGWKWQINLPALAAALPVLERNPLGPGDRFDGPSLFVAGANSAYVGPGDTGAIRSHFPSARVKTLADSGHNPHIEAREAFVKAVAADG
ncbi:MAG TPA: alpha/beta fold hydrolase [Opitutaceae bacterium]|nr:alpha/beta fold hydrolase [Opitutaceae bacterium]